MKKEISFWAMIGAMIFTAIATANPVHGTYFELAGIFLIFVCWFAAKNRR